MKGWGLGRAVNGGRIRVPIVVGMGRSIVGYAGEIGSGWGGARGCQRGGGGEWWKDVEKDGEWAVGVARVG